MKRIIYTIALCMAAAACTKSVPESLPGMEEKVPERVKITVGVPEEPSTKVLPGGIVNDNTAFDLQVFIFNTSDGTLDSYASNETAQALTLDCTTGKKNIYAVVNGPSLKTILTEEELLAQTLGYTSIDPAKMIMTGSQKNVTVTSSKENITITVKKRVARIKLKSVKNAITIPQYRNAEFKIEKVYLLNIPAEMPMMESPDHGSYTITWENFKQEHLRESTCWHGFNDRDLPSENGLLSPGSSYTDGLYFYSFENWSPDCNDESPENAPRYTRLVVVASIGGEYYNYPASIPNVEAGKTYDVSLTITRPGSHNPDKGIDKSQAGVSIKVTDWVAGTPVDQTI